MPRLFHPSGVFSRELAPMTIGLLLAITLNAFEALAVATVMPKAEEDLGGISLYSWAFSGYLLASIVGITWAGEQADRHGPGRPLAIGMTLFGIGLLVAGFAPSMLILVVGRCIQGLGAGALPAIAYVALGRAYPESLRPLMLAMFATAWVVPGLAGPAIAGAIAEWISWRGAFLLFVPVIPVMALLSLPPLFKLGPPGGEVAPSKLWLALTLTAGAAIAQAGISSGQPLLGTALVVLGVGIAARPLRKLLPAGTFRAAKGLPAAVAGTGFLNMAFFGAEAFIPYMLTTYRGYTALMAGLALTVTTLSWTAGSWIQERLVHRTSRAHIAVAGSLLVALGILLVSLALLDAVHGAWVSVAWGIGGLGMGLAYPMFSLELLSTSAAGREGEAAGAMKMNEMLMAAVGVGIAGGIVAAGENGGWTGGSLLAVFIFMSAIGVLTALVSTRLSSGLVKPIDAGAREPEPSPASA
jgi:MFS family permease